MSKQVERKGDNLIVRTREDYHKASKVIFMHKGETAKVFYPVVPTYINNLEDVKDWSICGYRVEELYNLALVLRDKRIEEVDLSDYNQGFIAGYHKANEDLKNSIEEEILKLIRG